MRLSEAGFVARGSFAVVLLAALGLALLWDSFTGKATRSDYQTFGGILILSAIATFAVSAFRKSSEHREDEQFSVPRRERPKTWAETDSFVLFALVLSVLAVLVFALLASVLGGKR